MGNSFTIEYGTAIFETANSPLTLNGVLLLANSGTLSVETGVVQLLGGGTVEDGLITVAAGTELDLTGVLMDSTASVDNAGLLNITDSVVFTSGQWTNAASGVVNFTGTYLALQTAFDNAGAVTAQTDALRSTELLLEGGGTTSGSFTVAGGGNVLDLYGTQNFTAASAISGGGTVEVISGVTTFGGTYDITGTTNIFATADFTGIAVTGNYVETSGGQLATLELGGTTPGNLAHQYAQLDVGGNVTLAGALDLSFINGFVSTAGETFTIIKNNGPSAVNGTFDGLAQGAVLIVGGRQLQINYAGGDGNDVTLTDVDA